MSATTTFKNWLIKARKKAELTYGQLAEKSGVSAATVHSIEHGGGSPSLDTADKLCKALGVSLEAAVRVRNKRAVIGPDSVSIIGLAEHSDPAADA
jgi:transcriptional regulator with XRE-family HTH domain